MRFSSTALLGLATSAAAGIIRRQDGPVAPDTDAECSYYDTAYSASDDCTHFEDYWGISHANFVAWVSWKNCLHCNSLLISLRILPSRVTAVVSRSATLTAS